VCEFKLVRLDHVFVSQLIKVDSTKVQENLLELCANEGDIF